MCEEFFREMYYCLRFVKKSSLWSCHANENFSPGDADKRFAVYTIQISKSLFRTKITPGNIKHDYRTGNETHIQVDAMINVCNKKEFPDNFKRNFRDFKNYKV
ncbi:hypothetical protein CEXT_301511 [Caerostris extrusa]|uniref:Uncharacterized protein n=1 Tax=Caerostris extrusa TaxID=172846 RepID=A0AAV4PZU7_CAEEX|nr:hypothetical protein CEXT_301511 [Caerostris extrusa]